MHGGIAPWPGLSLVDLWRSAVRQRPDAPFLTWYSEAADTFDWSYEEFDRLSDNVARELARNGVVLRSRVQVALPNCPEFVALWLACQKLGASMVPSDPSGTVAEFRHQAQRTAPTIAYARSDNTAFADGLTGNCRSEFIDDANWLLSLRETDELVAATPDPSAEASILFSSGTTAAPKGVVITQANYAYAGEVMASAAQLTATDRYMIVLPLFHANAQYYCLAPVIARGASVALFPRFSASNFVAQARRSAATHASLFAAPIRMILARTDPAEAPATLQHVWFAQNITRKEFLAFSRLAGCVPRQLYGMTETIAAVIANRPADGHHDQLGMPVLGSTVGLMTSQDSPAGEIVVRGVRGVTLFKEYLEDQELTESSFDGAWFRTGDMAVLEGGEYRFYGRSGDLLKVSGESVSASEIEAVLTAHRCVAEVAVVGKHDPVRDEVPVAYVVPSKAHTSDHAEIGVELTTYCRDQLAPAKQPRQFVELDELPHTSVGKIRKVALLTMTERDSHDPSG